MAGIERASSGIHSDKRRDHGTGPAVLVIPTREAADSAGGEGRGVAAAHRTPLSCPHSKRKNSCRPRKPTSGRCFAARPSISPACRRRRRRSTRFSPIESPDAYERRRRSAARLAPLRRALGPALARRRPLRAKTRPTPFASADRIRSAWRYRDWVIDAFNADMPYDRFVVRADRRRPAVGRRARRCDRIAGPGLLRARAESTTPTPAVPDSPGGRDGRPHRHAHCAASSG